jgi:hypothetical protein
MAWCALMLASNRLRVLLLSCGVLGALLFAITDFAAGFRYPGYNFYSQAISELFAVGAPTSSFVVPIFTIGSLLAVAFSLGVWMSAGGSRIIRLISLMFVGNAANGLILWYFYPMHMRGVEPTFTDTMHILLAGVGVVFVLLAVLFSAIYLRGWIRACSIIGVLVLLVPGAIVFLTIPGLMMGEPTPFVGLTERVSTYGYYLWQTAFIVYLVRCKE